MQKRKNNKYIPSDKQIKYVDAFLKLMKAVTGDKDYTVVNSREGVKNMCDILQGVKAEGEIVGTIKTLYSYMKKPPEEIADIVNQPIEYIKEVLNIS